MHNLLEEEWEILMILCEWRPWWWRGGCGRWRDWRISWRCRSCQGPGAPVSTSALSWRSCAPAGSAGSPDSGTWHTGTLARLSSPGTAPVWRPGPGCRSRWRTPPPRTPARGLSPGTPPVSPECPWALAGHCRAVPGGRWGWWPSTGRSRSPSLSGGWTGGGSWCCSHWTGRPAAQWTPAIFISTESWNEYNIEHTLWTSAPGSKLTFKHFCNLYWELSH